MRLSLIPLLAFYVSLASVIPATALFSVFETEVAWFLLSFHGSLFLYPVIFGVWQLAALYACVAQLLREPRTRENLKFLIAIAMFGLATAISFELNQRAALFELDPSTFEQPVDRTQDGTPLSLFDYLSAASPDSKEAASTFLKDALPTRSTAVDGFPTIVQLAYLASFSSQSVVFLCALLSFVWLVSLKLLSNPAQYSLSRKPLSSTYAPFLAVFLFSAPWIFWRIAFENHRADVLGASLLVDPYPFAILAIPFLISGLLLSILIWTVYGEKLEGAIGVLSSLGLGAILMNYDWLTHIFPRTASPTHYLLLLGVITLIVSPVLLASRTSNS